MTKFVCPVKFNKVYELDKGVLENPIIRIKPDRRYRVDRPKDVTDHLKSGVNSIQVQKSKDEQQSIFVCGLYLCKREKDVMRIVERVGSYSMEASVN